VRARKTYYYNDIHRDIAVIRSGGTVRLIKIQKSEYVVRNRRKQCPRDVRRARQGARVATRVIRGHGRKSDAIMQYSGGVVRDKPQRVHATYGLRGPKTYHRMEAAGAWCVCACANRGFLYAGDNVVDPETTTAVWRADRSSTGVENRKK